MTLRCQRSALAILLLLALVPAAAAHHPSAGLDEAIAQKEEYFQSIDERAPDFDLADAGGQAVSLSDFAGKVVILNFIFASCTDVCPMHSIKIAQVQKLINASPMKEMVQFVSITTDPRNDTAEVMQAYAETHGLDPSNWIFLTTRSGQAEDATRSLAERYGQKFTKTDDDQQMHAVVTHVVDADGRLAARFHGLGFEPLNMVLYINGLINGQHEKPRPASFWDRLWQLFGQ